MAYFSLPFYLQQATFHPADPSRCRSGLGKNLSTIYSSGNNIGRVSVKIHDICMFLQGASPSLEYISPLIDAVMAHDCLVCGSVPVGFASEGSNDPRWGILTINYVEFISCENNCNLGEVT